MDILIWTKDRLNELFSLFMTFLNQRTRSCYLFGIILILIGAITSIYLASQKYGYNNYYETQENKQINAFISQTLKQMQKEKELPLMTQKFYKDSVYKQLKKIIKSNYKFPWTRFISGKQDIGKSTSAIKIANQLKNKGYPVLYYSFKQSLIAFAKGTSIKQQFNKIIFENNIWKIAKLWNNSTQSYQIQKFNKQFKLKFGNKSPLIIFDQINFLFHYCAQKCPALIQIFFKQLTYVSQRRINVILITSDPKFYKYSRFKCFDSVNDVLQLQLNVNVDQDFNQMFKDLGFTKKTEEKFLQVFSQRGNILNAWKYSRKNKVCCQIKKVNFIIQNHIQGFLMNLQRFINSQKKHREERYKCLKNVCLQKSLTKMFVQDHLQYFHDKNILYQTEFKSKQMMKTFERYAKLYKNQVLVCKEN